VCFIVFQVGLKNTGRVFWLGSITPIPWFEQTIVGDYWQSRQKFSQHFSWRYRWTRKHRTVDMVVVVRCDDRYKVQYKHNQSLTWDDV